MSADRTIDVGIRFRVDKAAVDEARAAVGELEKEAGGGPQSAIGGGATPATSGGGQEAMSGGAPAIPPLVPPGGSTAMHAGMGAQPGTGAPPIPPLPGYGGGGGSFDGLSAYPLPLNSLLEQYDLTRRNGDREERERQRHANEVARQKRKAAREEEQRQQEEEQAKEQRAQWAESAVQKVAGVGWKVGGAISKAATIALGVGLGGSAIGFLMGSVEQYAAVSDVLTGLRAKFRDAQVAAADFGTSLGYQRAEAGRLAETLGGQTDSVDVGLARSIMGFARFTGNDVNQIAQYAGQTSRLSGREMDFGAIRGHASAIGMGRGRLTEFMDTYKQAEQTMFDLSGEASQARVQAVMAVPGVFYGSYDERSRGAAGQRFASAIHGTLSGGGDAMNLEMLRAMGYGSKGGPGYVEAMVRLEEGLSGKDGVRNLYDLGRQFMREGYTNPDQLFGALQGVWKGSKAQLRDFTRQITQGATLDQLESMSQSPDMALSIYSAVNRGNLNSMERLTLDRQGYEGLGRRNVSAGQAFHTEMEGMRMAVGPDMLGLTMDAMKMAQSLGRSMNNMLEYLVGENFSQLVQDVGEGMKKVGTAVEDMTEQLKNNRQGVLLDLIPDFLRDKPVPPGWHVTTTDGGGTGYGVQP